MPKNNYAVSAIPVPASATMKDKNLKDIDLPVSLHVCMLGCCLSFFFPRILSQYDTQINNDQQNGQVNFCLSTKDLNGSCYVKFHVVVVFFFNSMHSS